MFVGIIKNRGTVRSVNGGKDFKKVEIVPDRNIDLKEGESISVSGVCTTVVNTKGKSIFVEYMRETLANSNIGDLKKGQKVNLEESLRFGDKISGHYILGHVDAVGKVHEIKKKGKNQLLTIKPDKKVLGHILYKGSVAIEGVSLTVSEMTRDTFTVSLMPYTLKNTTIGQLRVGDFVNIETDMILKYAKLMVC